MKQTTQFFLERESPTLNQKVPVKSTLYFSEYQALLLTLNIFYNFF